MLNNTCIGTNTAVVGDDVIVASLAHGNVYDTIYNAESKFHDELGISEMGSSIALGYWCLC